MNRYICVALLVILAGCSTIGTEITKNNNQIQMPNYSFVVPPEQGWHLLRPNEQYEVALMTKKLGLSTFQMQIMRNQIIDKDLKALPAKGVADNYRNLEKQIMIEQGVNKGLYQLQDLAMAEETVGDKKYYTMTYVVLSNANTQWASLYLYFPKEEKNDFFILAHYSETAPPNTVLVKSLKAEFLETLKSMRVTQQGP
jgi:hypothetical protein